MAANAINRLLTSNSLSWLWMKESWGKRRRSRRYVVQYRWLWYPAVLCNSLIWYVSPLSPSISLSEKEETGMFIPSWEQFSPFCYSLTDFSPLYWQKKEPSKSKDDKKKQPKKKKKKTPWKSKRNKEQNQVCIHINISRGISTHYLHLTYPYDMFSSLSLISLTFTHSQRVLPLQWNS